MTAVEEWIEVVNWEAYQHRDAARSNVLPWIKNHTRLLSSPDYMGLTEHQALVLHRLWIEYARSLRQLRLNTASLSRQLGLRVMTRDLEALNHAGFIRFSASKPASDPASLEGDREREGSSKTQSSARAKANGHGEAFAIRTLIANGAIVDLVDLEAELRAHPTLTDDERDQLRAALPTTTVEEHDEHQPPTLDELRQTLADQATAAALAGRTWADLEPDLRTTANGSDHVEDLIDVAGDAYRAARHPDPVETTP